MKRALNPAWFLIPLVYVMVIFGLLYLQFAGATLFQTEVGPVSMTASFVLGGKDQDKQLQTLTLSYLSLMLPFTEKKGLEIQTQDDTIRTLSLLSYEKTEAGFTLGFDDEVRLDIDLQEGSDRTTLLLEVRLPRALVPAKAVRIPWQTVTGSTASAVPNSSGVLVSQGSDEFLLALPPRSFADLEDNWLIIPGDAESKNLVFGPKPQNNRASLEALFDPRVSSISEADYQALVAAWIDGAYEGWRGARYNSARNGWTTRDAEGGFDEEILVAYLAEAWNRNEYTRAFTDMRAAADANPTRLTHRSSVFLGNLRKITNDLVVQDQQRVTRYLAMISGGDLEILMEPGLIRFAADRGTRELQDRLRSFLESLDPEALSARHLMGFLGQIYLEDMASPDFDPLYQKNRDQFKTLMAKYMTRVDEGVFILEKEGSSSAYLNLLAGAILQKQGVRESDTGYLNLGRLLVSSTLALKDDLSYLPASMEIVAGALATLVGTTPPEQVYPLVTTNPSYPRYYSLYRSAGPGQWFYTVARVNSINISPAEYTFNISYPRNRTHYLVFGGMPNIDPIRGAQLFGIPWRSAPDFENYSKGRFYNRDTKYLMIKYFADSTNEVIKLWF